jgi:hypothetical protein
VYLCTQQSFALLLIVTYCHANWTQEMEGRSYASLHMALIYWRIETVPLFMSLQEKYRILLATVQNCFRNITCQRTAAGLWREDWVKLLSSTYVCGQYNGRWTISTVDPEPSSVQGREKMQEDNSTVALQWNTSRQWQTHIQIISCYRQYDSDCFK